MIKPMLSYALNYEKIGFSVFPIKPGKEKRPLVKWKPLQSKRATPAELRRWWTQWPNANIGIATGRISGFAVLDADSPEAVDLLEKKYPTSVYQTTGNGIHGFYRLDPLKGDIKNRAHVNGMALDVRGDGGYIVIAPSLHANGSRYTLEVLSDVGGWQELSVFPYDDIIKAPIYKDTTGAGRGNEREKDPLNLDPIEQGKRDDTLTRYTGRYCKMNMSYAEILLLVEGINSRRCKPPLPEDDVSRIVKSIFWKDKNEKLKVRIMTREDIPENETTLNLTNEVLDPGGLISLGVKALLNEGLPNIPQFLLPVVVTHIAAAIAGKLVCNNVWPNLYNVKISPSSLGKTRVDKAMRRNISKFAGFEKFYGPTAFASGPSLLRVLEDNPHCLLSLDEMKPVFARYGASDALSDDKRNVLLELYSNAGHSIHKAYSAKRDNIHVESPCLNLIGNTTSCIFDVVKTEDFDTGLLTRFDFWCYDGKMIPNKIRIKKDNLEMTQFINQLLRIYRSFPAEGRINISEPVEPYETLSTECQEILDVFSEQIANYANNPNNKPEVKALYSRQYDSAIKYGLIHMASTRPIKDLYKPMKAVNIAYGLKLAKILVDWKIKILGYKVSSGDLDQDCKIFIDAIKAAITLNRNPTFNFLINRRPKLGNWLPRYSEIIINLLVKRGQIIKDESQKITQYQLLKKEI